MESLVSFLATLNSLTPLAIIALLGTVIFLLVWKNPFKPLENKLTDVTENHLHELPIIAKNLEQAVEILQRIEVRQAEEFAYLRARVNGGSKH